jgi:hypothetical protein
MDYEELLYRLTITGVTILVWGFIIIGGIEVVKAVFHG